MVPAVRPLTLKGPRRGARPGKSRETMKKTAEKALIRGTAFFVILCLSVSGGCGYRFAPEGDGIDPSLRSVFVSPFPNRTDEPALGNILREAMILELRRGTRFQLAAGRTEADLLLRCRVRSYETYPVSYGEGNFARENRLRLSVDLVLEKRRDGAVLWSGENQSGTETYVISRDTRRTEQNRRAALKELAENLAERACRLMASGF